jgi:hypothetical protein
MVRVEVTDRGGSGMPQLRPAESGHHGQRGHRIGAGMGQGEPGHPPDQPDELDGRDRRLVVR